MAGPGGGENRVDAGLHEWLRAHHLDLHLVAELHDDRRAAVVLDLLLLPAVPAHAAQRDAGDAGAKQRLFNLREALGPDDRGDELHAGLPVDAR